MDKIGALLLCALVLLAGCQEETDRNRLRAMEVAREALGHERLHEVEYDRIRAAGILLEEGSVEGEEVLLEALTSGAETARQAAVGAVLAVRGPKALAWFGRIATQNTELQRAVLEGLRFNPRPDSAEVLREGIVSNDPKHQVAALDAAALAGDRSLLPVIEERMKTLEDGRMKAYAAWAASSLGSERLEGWIGENVGSKLELQREIAAACLGFVDSEWGAVELERLRFDPSPRIRIAAAASQTRHGISDARKYLTEQVLGNDARLAEIAAGAVRRTDPAYVVELASFVLSDPGVEWKPAGKVFEALGWAREVAARDVLERALSRDRHEEVRLQSIWAIGWRGRDDELDLIVPLMDDTSVAIRVMAAWAWLYNKSGGYKQGAGFLSSDRKF